MNRKTAGAFLASAALVLAALPSSSFAASTSTPPWRMPEGREIGEGIGRGGNKDAQAMALSVLLNIPRADAVNLLALKSFPQVVQEKGLSLDVAKAKVQSVELEARKAYWRALGVPESEITARATALQNAPKPTPKPLGKMGLKKGWKNK